MFSSLTFESTSADVYRRTLITRRSSEAWQTITRPRHHVTTSIVCTQTAMLTSESIVTSRTLCQQPVTTATVTLTTRLTPASQLAIHELTRLKGRCSTSTGRGFPGIACQWRRSVVKSRGSGSVGSSHQTGVAKNGRVK